MLHLCALLLELIVVVLKHLNELLVVLDPLLVVQLDGLKVHAKVVWHIGHFAELAIFSGQIIHGVRQSVDFTHQRGDFLLHGLLLFSEQLNALNGVGHVLIATVEGQILLKGMDGFQKLGLGLLEGLLRVVKSLHFALESIIFVLKAAHFSSLVLKSLLHLLSDNLLNIVDVVAGIVQFFGILVSHLLNKKGVRFESFCSKYK